MHSSLRRVTLAVAVIVTVFWLGPRVPVEGQQPPAGPGSPLGGRGGGVYPDTVADDNVGFVPIFDGKTLTGWDGDMQFWRVENGEIVGETTPERPAKANSFLIGAAARSRTSS